MDATPTRGRTAWPLTEAQIKNAKPRDKAFKLYDPGGLVLLVTPGGSKLWRYRFWLDSKAGMLALGRYPETSLKRARELHRAAREAAATGANPVHQKRAAELEASLSSFDAVIASWRSTSEKGLRAATKAQRKREIENDLLPKFSGRQVTSLTRIELSAHLRKVEARAPETARNLRSHLNAMFEHAIDLGLVTVNPTPPRRVLRPRVAKHHPALAPHRMGEFLRSLESANLALATKTAMLLMLLTACRKNEVTAASWSEFDLASGTWVIPADRMKGKRPHWVPLSKQAIELLQRLRNETTGTPELLFPNRRDPKRPMANRSLNAVFDRLGFGEAGTPHGMRAAFSTHFNKLSANIDVIEHCLAHVPANKVRSAYNRHEYQEERRAMLQLWADHLGLQRSLADA